MDNAPFMPIDCGSEYGMEEQHWLQKAVPERYLLTVVAESEGSFCLSADPETAAHRHSQALS